MLKTSIFLTIILSLFYIKLSGQTQPSSDANSSIVKAHYLEDDLDRLLEKKTNYPREAVENRLQGDVIISLRISKDGQLDTMSIVKSSHILFTSNSILSFNDLSNKWSPCIVDGEPTDSEYLCVFRYRLYMDSPPPDYKKQAGKLIAKDKLKKAIKVYDRAILDSPYDYKHYLTRSKLKEIDGDADGALSDYNNSVRLQNKVISLTDVSLVGITRER